MDGYKRVPASWSSVVPIETAKACGMCPRHQDDAENPCNTISQCDAGHGLVWVPDHIYALYMMNADAQDKRHLERMGLSRNDLE